MKLAAAALGFALVVGTIALAQTPAPTPSAVVADALRDTQAPALGVVVIRDGRIDPVSVRGVRRLGGAPIQTGDRWNIGSDAKAMTATMVARLVDRGALSWTTPLEQLLPELAADMRPEYRDVTLLELLSHRAGLPENISDMTFFATFYEDRRPLPLQRLAYLKRAVAEAPAGPARGEPSYSNTGLLLAAAAAERATGKSFETLMQEEVFAPLGITTATYDQAVGDDEPAGHVDGRVAVRSDANPQMMMPAGGVRISLGDWAKFCLDQMKGEHGQGVLLKAETYKVLHTPQGDTRSGLGWGVGPKAMGRAGPALSHAGSDGNWYAVVVLYPNALGGVLAVANAGEGMGADKVVMLVAKTLVPLVAPAAPVDQ
ncbi:MAG TPA: serine hydrolase domain-containing protein [Caulobacter sp.]|nr:serine hydrolase domain-containing protein [Caulobacter sp.]